MIIQTIILTIAALIIIPVGIACMADWVKGGL